jgi:hypothetical protein
MAEPDERLTQINELVERAEGYISDAEFREEQEIRMVRYLQAVASTMLALKLQNEMVIELLRQQQELDRLAAE